MWFGDGSDSALLQAHFATGSVPFGGITPPPEPGAAEQRTPLRRAGAPPTGDGKITARRAGRHDPTSRMEDGASGTVLPAPSLYLNLST